MVFRGGCHPPLQIVFQGRVTHPPALVNSFSGAGGSGRPYTPLENHLQEPVTPHPPLIMYLQGRPLYPPLQTGIFSCKNQGRLRGPPQKCILARPYKSFLQQCYFRIYFAPTFRIYLSQISLCCLQEWNLGAKFFYGRDSNTQKNLVHIQIEIGICFYMCLEPQIFQNT